MSDHLIGDDEQSVRRTPSHIEFFAYESAKRRSAFGASGVSGGVTGGVFSALSVALSGGGWSIASLTFCVLWTLLGLVLWLRARSVISAWERAHGP